jgi:hypothetical protein
MIDVFVKTSQVFEDERVILSCTRGHTLICTQKNYHELDENKNKNKNKIKMRNKKITISKFHMLIPNTFTNNFLFQKLKIKRLCSE